MRIEGIDQLRLIMILENLSRLQKKIIYETKKENLHFDILRRRVKTISNSVRAFHQHPVAELRKIDEGIRLLPASNLNNFGTKTTSGNNITA